MGLLWEFGFGRQKCAFNTGGTPKLEPQRGDLGVVARGHDFVTPETAFGLKFGGATQMSTSSVFFRPFGALARKRILPGAYAPG